MTARRAYDSAGTAARILDVAEQLVQVRGFNGFSYADIASELKITKAALHYHFAVKADLGEALINRYATRFISALAEVDGSAVPPPAKLAAYADLYAQVLRRRRMCLCGMLAAEYQTLPRGMQDAVVSFFDENESWLAGVLRDGREGGSLRFAGADRDAARMIINCLEGAMLMARPYGDVSRFRAAAASLLAGFTPVTAQVPGLAAAQPA
ncbi:MAG TPA: TetR/AcrR family transcriptional regulator [Streptosporangiaceae bacterium]|nr:TetR/AcrR family transcriptional regulator [Streptosporangiaceae bacterium]